MGLKESFTRENASENVLGYDDAASYYFGVCVLFCIAAPWTFVFIRSLLGKAKKTTLGSVMCKCSACAVADEKREKGVPSVWDKLKHIVNLLQVIVLCLLWFSIAGIIYTVSGQEGITHFDPWEVLELTRGANNKDIRKAYRTLSLKLHPDRNQNDPSAAARFILVTKAYQALTDDTAKRNFERYGNPDGPGIMKIGIGLPQFLIKKENQLYILMVFFLFLLVVVPGLFIMHYRRTSQFHPCGLRYSSAHLLATELTKDMRVRQILQLLGAIEEGRSNNSCEPAELRQLMDLVGELTSTKRLFDKDTIAIRNFCLLLAQIQGKREQLSPNQVKVLNGLLDSVDLACKTLLEVAVVRKWVAMQTTIIDTQRSLVQGKMINAPVLTLLQIPHFDSVMINKVIKGRNAPKDLAGFLDAPPETRSKILNGFSPEQIADIEAFCLRAPKIAVVAEVYVQDEKEIAEGDILTVSVKIVREYLREGDEAGQVHCPNWPFERYEKFYVFVSEAHTGNPIAFMETSGCDKEMEVKALRPTPPKGKHSIRVQVINDSYAGLDVHSLVEFKGKKTDKNLLGGSSLAEYS